MNLETMRDLDGFLAVAEITGDRFGTYSLQGCALGRWAQERGLLAGIDLRLLTALPFTRIAQALGTSCTRLEPVWEANDASKGNPSAVRATLHRMFPVLKQLPTLTPAGGVQ